MKLYRNLSLFALIICTGALLSGCQKDNLEPPASTLKGMVVYQGQAIGVRTPTVSNGAPNSGVQLELWQRGYQLFTKIPVYVAQDGSYSASVFDGDYKLVRLKGTGPWVDNTDTIDVKVRGNTVVDVPVTPYFTISNATYTFSKSDTSVTATFTVNQVVPGKTIDFSTLYIGSTGFVDVNNLIVAAEAPKVVGSTVSVKLIVAPSNYPNITNPNVVDKSVIRQNLTNIITKKYAYFRIGVKANAITERIYTPVQKVEYTF